MMKFKNAMGILAVLLASATMVMPASAQAGRGKAELSAPGGKIVVDYGRPELKGRDPLTWQKDGDYWRMGMNNMTTFSTPVDLTFGSTRVAKGTYGIWLLKVSADQYQLVFNSETAGMGMNHDKAKDVAGAAMKKETAPGPVETLTIELKSAPGGGIFVMSWGTFRLSSEFQIGK